MISSTTPRARLSPLDRMVSRRTLLSALCTTIAGATLVRTASRPAVAGSLTADDVFLESSNGRIDAVTVAPTLSVAWTGLGDVPRAIAGTVFVDSTELGGGPYRLSTDVQSLPAEAQAATGSTTYNLPTYTLTDSPYGTGDFNAGTQNGNVNQTPVTVWVEVSLLDAVGTPYAVQGPDGNPSYGFTGANILGTATTDSATFTVQATNV